MFLRTTGSPAGHLGERGANLRPPLAAILHEVEEKRAHGVKVSRIKDRTPIPATEDEACIGKNTKLSRQRVGRNAERPGDITGRNAALPGLHQQAENGKPAFLGKGGKAFDGEI